jgi:hypothetical protein
MADHAPDEAGQAAGGTGLTPEEERAAAIEAGRLLFAAECRFFFAAQRLDQLPEPHLPEVAFAGRSNVGKSSLVNALTGRRALARASHTPGRTKQLNFFDLGGRLVLVDADEVCVSNTNRQLHALDGQYGRAKAEVLAERVRAIHPGCRVEVLQRFLAVDTLEAVLGDGHDLVLEAADSVPPPVDTIWPTISMVPPRAITGSTSTAPATWS